MDSWIKQHWVGYKQSLFERPHPLLVEEVVVLEPSHRSELSDALGGVYHILQAESSYQPEAPGQLTRHTPLPRPDAMNSRQLMQEAHSLLLRIEIWVEADYLQRNFPRQSPCQYLMAAYVAAQNFEAEKWRGYAAYRREPSPQSFLINPLTPPAKGAPLPIHYTM